MKERLDKLLFIKGIVKSRELAKALIIEGNVFVDGQKVTKAGTFVSNTALLSLKETPSPFVGRGGLKLDAALRFFNINVQGTIVMDVGSSTGGFTDCVLQSGAQKVYSIDVGYGQLDWNLRNNSRVVVLERTNIRYLSYMDFRKESEKTGKSFDELIQRTIDMATIDVSFISLTKVIPVIRDFLKNDGVILALVKPQFEVGKGEVGKGGLIREENKRMKAVRNVQEQSDTIGFETLGIFKSPVVGQKGNREYFLYARRKSNG